MDTIQSCQSLKITFYKHTISNGVVYHHLKAKTEDGSVDLDLKDRYSNMRDFSI